MSGSLIFVLDGMLWVYFYMMVVYALLSWVMHEEHYPPIVRWLQSIVEPVLFQIRKVIPPIGGFDISAIAALLIVEIIHTEILKLII